VTAWNSGAEKVFGYTAAESLGKSLDRLLPPEHPNEESEILTRVTRGERINHFETTRCGRMANAFIFRPPSRP